MLVIRGPLASSFKLHLSDILGFFDKVSIFGRYIVELVLLELTKGTVGSQETFGFAHTCSGLPKVPSHSTKDRVFVFFSSFFQKQM